ncbi:MAG: hypothetical protein WBQ18_02885 [Solirubrobacteraceae bacterium]
MQAPEDVRRYLERLANELQTVLRSRLRGLYALGGLALGDYRPGRSDIDVYGVVDEPLDDERKLAVAEACRHRTIPCPARKLELVIVSAGVAAAPGSAPDWELNLNTGAAEPDHIGLNPAAEARHWFVIDLAIAHQHGLRLFGPAAPELIGAPDPAVIQAAQSQAIVWFARHGRESDAAATACRAWFWHETGTFTTKRQAIRWAAQRL